MARKIGRILIIAILSFMYIHSFILSTLLHVLSNTALSTSIFAYLFITSLPILLKGGNYEE